ncbi:hypothetical protein P3W33_17535 [Luteibacter sp. PPL552]
MTADFPVRFLHARSRNPAKGDHNDERPKKAFGGLTLVAYAEQLTQTWAATRSATESRGVSHATTYDMGFVGPAMSG